MLLTFKRALTIPFLAVAVVLPVLAAHPAAAHAATARPAAAATSEAATFQATATTRAAAVSTAAADARTAVASASSRARHHRSRRLSAYIWAAHQRGKPYCWGGTGGCFDCSGLVMAAYRHQGLYFGRDTIDMLSSGRLIRVGRRHARKGDLAFYGTGHVELVGGRHYTLGALHFGTVVGWHRLTVWWHPTMYFRVRGAGRRG
jgi:cell wall-associated NlpC family hydrolase